MGGPRIYTRTGDEGTTFCVAAGGRVSKASTLIELVGSIDEASSSIGFARSLCAERSCRNRIIELLDYAQRLVFYVGYAVSGADKFSGDEVEYLEKIIDDLMEGIELRGFVLTGTTLESASIHIARTAVRRAERRLQAAIESGALTVTPAVGYARRVLNRLSDALFAAAVRIEADRGALKYV